MHKRQRAYKNAATQTLSNGGMSMGILGKETTWHVQNQGIETGSRKSEQNVSKPANTNPLATGASDDHATAGYWNPVNTKIDNP